MARDLQVLQCWASPVVRPHPNLDVDGDIPPSRIDLTPGVRPRGVLPYMGYIGNVRPQRVGFFNRFAHK